MKTAAVWIDAGTFALFFRLHHGALGSSIVLLPGNMPSKSKKNANTHGVSPGVGGWAAYNWIWLIHNIQRQNNELLFSVT